MKFDELIESLNGEELFCPRNLRNVNLTTAAASDLMSDILSRTEIPDVLLTRLTNTQVIHTASIFGIRLVVVIRNRPIEDKLIKLAEKEKIALVRTAASLFESCGMLYECGIRSI